MRLFPGWLFVFISLTACRKNSDPPISINGFVVTDAFGNVITNIGSVDDDWKTGSFSSLPVKEQELLHSGDSLPPLNTVVSNVTVYPAYPNPAAYETRFTCNSTDSVVLRIMIVDEKGTVFRQFFTTLKGLKTFAFDISDRTKFPSGKSLRCIYAFSAAGNQNFKTGHGDIKVCDQSNYTSCF